MRVVYELFHDTSFGYVLRAVLGRHAFAYPDELEGAESLKRCLRSATAPNTPAAPNTPGPVPLEKATREDINPSNEVSDALAAETAERTGRTPIPPSRAFHPEGSDDRHSTASTRVDMGAIEPAQKKAEAGYDRDLVGWYDENDIDNPQNWSRMKKLWVTWQTVFLCFGIYMGSAIFAGGMPEIEEKFGVSDVVATIGLCLYVIGYGIGPVFFAPLTEIPQIGRMPVYVVTLFIFLMLNIPLAKATNIGMVLSFRFLTGFFGSPILSVGGATMADMWSSSSRMYAIFMWCFFAHIAVVMGPLIGGFIGFYKGSAWITWMLMALNGAVFIHLFFFFPETNPSSILYHRARRLRKATQNKELRSQSEIDAANTRLMDIVTVALIRPLVFNVTEPIVIALNTWLGLVYAVLYLWFESFPMVFYDQHHLPLQNIGLTYIGLLVGTFMAAPPFLLWWKWVQVPKFAKYGKDLKPEEVLPSAIVAAILVPICLFWFGWTSHPDIHWIVPIIASSLFGAASVILFTVILDYLANTYPLYAASVLAGNALVRCSFAGSWPIFARALYHTIGIDWASTMLGFFSAAFAFIPILLYFYGVKIRNMSKRARHDY